MIVIAGDSWGCGEWEGMNVTHGGLAQYLLEDKYNVINLSVGGSSNWEIYERIKLFFDSNIPNYLTEAVEMVLVFQTEWTRDFSVERSTCIQSNIEKNAISCWQYRLSDIAIKQKVKIGLIGGCSDTMYFDNIEKEYPGLFIACQSFTNLCVNDNHRINDPAFFCRPGDELLPKLENHYKKYSSTDSLINDLDKGIKRMNVFKNNKNWFYPDGIHPNQQGHKKLYDYLKMQNIV